MSLGTKKQSHQLHELTRIGKAALVIIPVIRGIFQFPSLSFQPNN
jgi:hypothetical protein